jgi:hypothetical protein
VRGILNDQRVSPPTTSLKIQTTATRPATHMITKTPLARILAACVLSLASITAEAAIITWGAPAQISGDANVSTNGNLVGAFNIGDTGVPATGPINGVNFQPFALPTGGLISSVGAFTITTAPVGFFSNNTSYGSANPPFSALSPNYQTLLRSGTSIFNGDTLTLTMNALTAGTQYEFQWWANFSGFGTELTTATAGNAITLADNTTGAAGGLGQYAIGSFIADATSQSIVFTGGPLAGSFNGFQLREVIPSGGVIPEPTTALFGVALVGFCFAGRRRKQAQPL